MEAVKSPPLSHKNGNTPTSIKDSISPNSSVSPFMVSGVNGPSNLQEVPPFMKGIHFSIIGYPRDKPILNLIQFLTRYGGAIYQEKIDPSTINLIAVNFSFSNYFETKKKIYPLFL